MSEKGIFGNTVVLDGHNVETSQYKESTKVWMSDIGRNVIQPYKIAEMLANMVNGGGCGRPRGRETGKALHKAHRTIQMVVVSFLIGILEGLAENEGIDVRNRAAIATAKRMVQAVGHNF